MRRPTASRPVTAACLLALVFFFAEAAVPAPAQGPISSGDALVEAERAFSRLAVKIGHIPAFLAYFADDVITFQPVPGAGKDRLREAAARMPTPPSVKADWEPWFAATAAARDLGYTTGPTIFSDAATGKVLRTGWYFSVWKHDVYGWRVAADIGVQAPPAGPLRPRAVEFAPAARGKAARTRDDLLAVERDLASAIASEGPAKAYGRYTAPGSRFYRDGNAPIVGSAAIERFVDGHVQPFGCRAVEAVMSKSGDLGYCAGECDAAPTPGAAPVKVGFLRVWTNAPGGWLLAADVVTR